MMKISGAGKFDKKTISLAACILFISLLLPLLSWNERDDTAAERSLLLQPKLTALAYSSNADKLLWAGLSGHRNRTDLLQLIDSAAWLGLDPQHYRPRTLQDLSARYSGLQSVVEQQYADSIFTDAALSLLSDLHSGRAISSSISYDEISLKHAGAANETIVSAFRLAQQHTDLRESVRRLEPGGAEYRALKAALAATLPKDSGDRARKLAGSMNLYRWMFHFGLERFIVVNIPSATLKLYEQDTVRLHLRTIVGSTYHRTPGFSAFCKGVVLYPYWNVPHSIAVNELLPAVKKDRGYLARTETQVLNSKGRILDPRTINWAALNKGNFPYRFREVTGCHNPLGVIKFDISDPFSVYIHDTNFPALFQARNRFYSHGCIRLEHPEALANAILPEPVDTAFLQACYKEQEPVYLKLTDPVPVFVVYMMAEGTETGEVRYFHDVYKLLR